MSPVLADVNWASDAEQFQRLACDAPRLLAAASAASVLLSQSREFHADAVTLVVQLLKRIKEGGLTAAFLDEGCRFEKLLRTFPLFLVTNEQVGLLGAREYAIKLLTMPGACKQSDINE